MDIKGKIKEKGFSMVSVAKEMGITRETLYANISGNTTYKTMRKVADVIGCDISEFFEDEEGKKGDFASYIRYKGIHYTADTLDEFFTRPDVDVWSRERGRIEAIFFEDLLYVEGRTMKARGLRILAFGRTPRRFRIASWLDRGRGGGMDDFFCARGFGGCEIEIGRGEIDDCICMRGLDGIV